MKTIVSIRKHLLVIGGAAALGTMLGAAQGRAHAAEGQAPQPDCGPTRFWNCVLPRCPDCYEVLFEGTVCEKNAFEKKTGRVCTAE